MGIDGLVNIAALGLLSLVVPSYENVTIVKLFHQEIHEHCAANFLGRPVFYDN